MNTETKLSALKTAALLSGILFLVLLFFFGGIIFTSFNKENTKAFCGVVAPCIPELTSKPEVEKFLGTEYNPTEGQVIFKLNCAACHNPTKKIIGPAMTGLSTRVPSKEWLSTYIADEESLINQKEAYTLEINDNWVDEMNHNFDHLSEEDLTNLSGYILGFD